MLEEWRTVPNFEEYEVSNLGRLKLKGTINDERAPAGRGIRVDGQPRTRQRKIVSPVGAVCLVKEKRNHWFRIAQLVLRAFTGPPPPGKELARHLDDTPTNNRLDNLAWGSALDNYNDAVRNGHSGPGSAGAIVRGDKLRGVARPAKVIAQISQTKRAHPERQYFGGERDAHGRWQAKRQ